MTNTHLLHPLAFRHARLWGEIATLCRQGFVVDPYEGQVLIADFSLESVNGGITLSKSDQARSSNWPMQAAHAEPWSTSEVQANAARFAEFARLRWPPQYQAGWKLRAAHSAIATARSRGDAPSSPAEQRLQSSVNDALASLPAGDRDLLQAFVLKGLPHEWHLAVIEQRPILDVRLSVIVSLVTLLRALQALAAPVPGPWSIAAQVWGDGLHPVNIARSSSISTAEVMSAQTDMGILLARAVRATSANLPALRDFMYKPSLDRAIEVLQREGRGAADGYCRRYRTALLAELEEPNAQLPSVAIQAVATANPELLAEMYKCLLPEAFSAETSPASEAYQVAADHARQSSVAVGKAFAELVDGLDSRMSDWPHVLVQVEPQKWYRDQLLAMPSIEAAGLHGRKLVEFGLAPETIAGVARSLQLHLDRVRAGHRMPAFFADDDELLAVEYDRSENVAQPPLTLKWSDLLGCVLAAAYAPVDPRLAVALAHWILRVAAERPFFVPGFECEVVGESTDDTVLRAQPAPRLESAQELTALWIRRRPAAQMEVSL